MGVRIADDALGRPVAEVERAAELVKAAMRDHREAVGRWGPDTPDVERITGMWSAWYWLDGQPCGPFTDGPATRERLRIEAYAAMRVVRGEGRSSRYTPAQCLGIAQFLAYAAGAQDVLPGVIDTPEPRYRAA